jgi:hypothetical protein
MSFLSDGNLDLPRSLLAKEGSKGFSTGWAMMLVVIIIASALLFGLWPEGKSFEEATEIDQWDKYQEWKAKVVAKTESVRVEQWIITNGLNKYGDAPETAYDTGSPLTDEAGEQIMERFDYILENHPDRPWNN